MLNVFSLRRCILPWLRSKLSINVACWSISSCSSDIDKGFQHIFGNVSISGDLEKKISLSQEICTSSLSVCKYNYTVAFYWFLFGAVIPPHAVVLYYLHVKYFLISCFCCQSWRCSSPPVQRVSPLSLHTRLIRPPPVPLSLCSGSLWFVPGKHSGLSPGFPACLFFSSPALSWITSPGGIVCWICLPVFPAADSDGKTDFVTCLPLGHLSVLCLLLQDNRNQFVPFCSIVSPSHLKTYSSENVFITKPYEIHILIRHQFQVRFICSPKSSQAQTTNGSWQPKAQREQRQTP